MDNIFALIPRVMKSIGAIGKDRTNPQQHYQFRGIDDLYNAVQSALIEHKVFTVPKVLEMTREERTSGSGGRLLYTILKMEYTFYAEDGSKFEAVTIGEAMDSGDKSCNKAMSAAQKYALIQVFCIPTEEPKDTENETHELRGKPTGGKPLQTGTPSKPETDKKSDSPDTGTIKVQVTNVTEKTGTRKDKTTYPIFAIHVGEQKYITFSRTVAANAMTAQKGNIPVTMEYKSTQYGPEIVSLTLYQPESPQPQSDLPTPAEEAAALEARGMTGEASTLDREGTLASLKSALEKFDTLKALNANVPDIKKHVPPELMADFAGLMNARIKELTVKK